MLIGVALLVVSLIFSRFTSEGDRAKNGLVEVIGNNFIYGLTTLTGQGRNVVLSLFADNIFMQ